MNANISQTIKFHTSKAPLRVLGSGFTLMALGMGAVHLTSGFSQTDSESGLWILLLVFLIAGLGMLGGFRRVVVDAGTRTASIQWGILRPFSTKLYALNETEIVKINKEVRVSSSNSSSGSGSSKTIVYPVRLIGVNRQGPISNREKKKALAKKNQSDTVSGLAKKLGGELIQDTLELAQQRAKDGIENIIVSESRDPIRARSNAERLAKLLGLALEDHVGETVSRREHDELDQSLRERLRKSQSVPKVAATGYTGKRLKISDHGGDKEYRFSFTNNWYSIIIVAAAPLFIFFTIDEPIRIVNDLLNSHFGNYAQPVATGLVAIVVLALLVFCFGAYLISADRHRVDVNMQFLGITIAPRRRLLVSELEEVILDSNAIVFISDTKRVRIKTGSLSDDDVQYLHDSILFTISR